MEDFIVDHETDGKPIHFVDLMAKVGEFARKLGVELEITDDPVTGKERFRLIEIEAGALERISEFGPEETWRRLSGGTAEGGL